MENNVENINGKVQSGVRKIIGQANYDNWFKNSFIKIEGEEDSHKVHLYTHSTFTKDWIHTHYIDVVYQVVSQLLDSKNVQICIEVRSAEEIQSLEGESPSILEEFETNNDLQYDFKHTFENFITGKSNELAYTAAIKVCETINKPDFNPLFIYGEPGVGKSHLLSAISVEVKIKNPNLVITHMTAESFMYSFVKALREKDVMSFKDELRATQLLLIDDVHFMIGKDSTQEEFFHTFNYLKEKGCQIVLSSDKPPSQLAGIEERLKSRLGWGLSVEIHPPSTELRLAILQSKLKEEEIKYEADAIEFLAQNIKGNLRDLEGAWTKIIMHCRWLSQTMTVELIQSVLADVLQSYDRTIKLRDIQLFIGNKYGVTIDQLNADVRKKNISAARHIGIYLSRELTDESLMNIAREFGGRDHTSVLYAIKKIQAKIKDDKAFEQEMLHNVKQLKRVI